MKKLLILLSFLPILLATCYFPGRFSSTMTSEERAEQHNRMILDVKNGKIKFNGGDGTSIKNAIKISGVYGDGEATDAEYIYLENKFGKRNADWELIEQSSPGDNGKIYDKLDIKDIKSNTNTSVYFDITDTYGK